MTTIKYRSAGTMPLFDASNLAGALKVLSESDVAATHWSSSDGGPRVPFDADDITALVDGSPSNHAVYVFRSTNPRWEFSASLSRRPFLFFDGDASDSADVSAIATTLVELDNLYEPDISSTWFGPELEWTWSTPHQRDLLRLLHAVLLAPSDYYRMGPGGLGVRTLLGPHYVKQFGRDRLLGTPVHIMELAWGGVRLDLVEDPWNTSMERLVDAWRRGMEHLSPAGIFADVEIDEGEKFIDYVRKGSNVVIGGVLPKES